MIFLFFFFWVGNRVDSTCWMFVQQEFFLEIAQRPLKKIINIYLHTYTTFIHFRFPCIICVSFFPLFSFSIFPLSVRRAEAEDRRQRLHFCRFPFAAKFVLNGWTIQLLRGDGVGDFEKINKSCQRTCTDKK